MKRIANIGLIDVVTVLIVTAVIAFALLGSRAFPICATLYVAYLIPYGLYYKSKYCATEGLVALSVAFVSMALFMLLNYWQSTVVLGSADAPFLLYDARSFYILSHDIYNGTVGPNSPIVPYMGYPLFLSWWLHAGIVDIAYPTIVNIALMMCAIIVLGRCVYFIIDDYSTAQRVSGYAMMLVAVIPGVLGMSTLLAKEPFIIYAILLCVCAIYAIKQGYKLLLYIPLLIVGLVILAACRTTYIYIIGLYVVAIYCCSFTRRDVYSLLLVTVPVIVALYIGIYFSWWGEIGFVESYISDSDSRHHSFICGESQLPMQQLVGPYNTYPLWQRILLLPVSVAVQFMIPFPFETATQPYGLPISMTVYHRMSYLWYAAAIPMLVFYLFYWWRRGTPMRLNILAAVSAISYCVPAFMTGGTVSRYAFCFVPLLAVMGGYVIHRIVNNLSELKRMVIFVLLYVILISAALFIGAHPQLIM